MKRDIPDRIADLVEERDRPRVIAGVQRDPVTRPVTVVERATRPVQQRERAADRDALAAAIGAEDTADPTDPRRRELAERDER